VAMRLLWELGIEAMGTQLRVELEEEGVVAMAVSRAREQVM